MANKNHVKILREGVDVWNKWRIRNPSIEPDLSHINCIAAELPGAWLRGADFTGANFSNSNFRKAVLTDGTLTNANFSYTNLSYSSLKRADAKGVDLRGAYMDCADLTGTDLQDANLFHASLNNTKLIDVNFLNANLCQASLRHTTSQYSDLTNAHLPGADLVGADFSHANIKNADLSCTKLLHSNLSYTDLSRANLSGALLGSTIFGDTNLTETKGLETCKHSYSSIIDQRTLMNSGSLPLLFLRGCGLPDKLIRYIPSLLADVINYHSCFISYSSKDHTFAERLHADLQNNGVRCWFAPEDLKIGEEIREGIDESICKHDKLLLILSKFSIKSHWVQQEVETALSREREQGREVLFPVRLDDTIMNIGVGWPALIRNTRFIGDFRKWKTPEKYKEAFDRLLHDLKSVPQ